MTTVLVLEPPCKFINANDRLHWRTRNDRTQAWRARAAVAVITNADRTNHYELAHITITYRFPDNGRRDIGNWQPTSKAIVDGLVDAGLIPDDSDRHVVGPDNRRDYPNGPPRVTVTIEEVR